MVQELRGCRVQDGYQDEVQAWVQDEVQAWVQGQVQDRWGSRGSGKGSGEVQVEVSTGSGTRGGHEVQGRVQEGWGYIVCTSFTKNCKLCYYFLVFRTTTTH